MLTVIALAVLLVLVCAGALMMEFHHYQRGRITWDWVARIYDRYNLNRIKW